MLIRPINKNAPDKKISIRQFPSPEHPYIAFPSKNLTVLDISRFTFCKVDYKVVLILCPCSLVKRSVQAATFVSLRPFQHMEP